MRPALPFHAPWGRVVSDGVRKDKEDMDPGREMMLPAVDHLLALVGIGLEGLIIPLLMTMFSVSVDTGLITRGRGGGHVLDFRFCFGLSASLSIPMSPKREGMLPTLLRRRREKESLTSDFLDS